MVFVNQAPMRFDKDKRVTRLCPLVVLYNIHLSHYYKLRGKDGLIFNEIYMVKGK